MIGSQLLDPFGAQLVQDYFCLASVYFPLLNDCGLGKET